MLATFYFFKRACLDTTRACDTFQMLGQGGSERFVEDEGADLSAAAENWPAVATSEAVTSPTAAMMGSAAVASEALGSQVAAENGATAAAAEAKEPSGEEFRESIVQQSTCPITLVSQPTE